MRDKMNYERISPGKIQELLDLLGAAGPSKPKGLLGWRFKDGYIITFTDIHDTYAPKKGIIFYNGGKIRDVFDKAIDNYDKHSLLMRDIIPAMAICFINTIYGENYWFGRCYNIYHGRDEFVGAVHFDLLYESGLDPVEVEIQWQLFHDHEDF